MRAIAAVLLTSAAIVTAPSPSAAGFRYVPPGADAASAEPVAKGQFREVPAEVDGSGADPVPAVWRVHAGETLRDALARWGARAGVEILVLTDRRYRLDGAAAFEGGFADAVQALFGGLSHLPHAPVAERPHAASPLIVRHRAAVRDEGRNDP